MDNDESPKLIRILIAEDQEYLREGIRRILTSQPGMEVPGVAKDGLEALQLQNELQPDILLLDIHMPGMNGIEVAQRVRAHQPAIALLLLSQYDDLAYVHQFLGSDSAGKGYLLKSTLGDIKTLVQAIKAVVAGQLVLDPQLAERLLQTAVSGLNQLTKREQRILAEMARGLDNQAIADTLAIEQSTVENHINSIYGKLDIGQKPGQHRRVEAVLRFLKGS
ncbi:MAG: response regulator transcription factor [Anaerolineae bacterium]|jgi:DNA-binding NarL/FixJ family response regulator|nr:response regulator transcription factor [Anaerolineae bacterium]